MVQSGSTILALPINPIVGYRRTESMLGCVRLASCVVGTRRVL